MDQRCRIRLGLPDSQRYRPQKILSPALKQKMAICNPPVTRSLTLTPTKWALIRSSRLRDRQIREQRQAEPTLLYLQQPHRSFKRSPGPSKSIGLPFAPYWQFPSWLSSSSLSSSMWSKLMNLNRISKFSRIARIPILLTASNSPRSASYSSKKWTANNSPTFVR